MLPYTIISLDLDYTLLDAHHQISPRNRAAVCACAAQGAKVVLTSGRMYQCTLPYAQQLALSTPIISYNGAYIKDPGTGEMLAHQTLDLATAHELIARSRHEGWQLNYYLDDALFTAAATPWAQLYAERTGAPLHVVGDLRTIADRPPTKLLIVDEPARIAARAQELTPQYAGRAYMTISNAEYLEFMPPSADKGRALALIAEFFGVPREEVIAFGDANNDIPVLAWAGLGVAMANAKPEAKAVADRIAPAYDEDGVAVVLEELFRLPAR
jgi:Cof subfamily protein (haloacid dehalogenase superfamily)